MQIKKQIALVLASVMFLSGCNLQKPDSKKDGSSQVSVQEVEGVISQMPANSVFLTLSNSDLLIQKTEETFDAVYEFLKQFPEVSESDLQEVEMIKPVVFNVFKNINSFSMFFRADESYLSKDAIKTAIEDDTIEELLMKNTCAIVALDADSPEVNMVLMELKKEIPEEIDYLQKENRYTLTIGTCSEEDKAISQNTEITQKQNMFFYADFNLKKIYGEFLTIAEEELAEDKDYLGVKNIFEGFSNQVMTIRFIQLLQNIKKVYCAFNVTDDGFERSLTLEVPNKDLQKVTKEFLEGKAMTKPMFLSEATKYSFNTVVKDDFVIHKEEYSNVDLSLFIGSVISFYSNAGMFLPIGLGIIATGSVAMFTGAQKKARDAVRKLDINALAMAIEQYAVDNRGELPIGIEETENIISSDQMENGSEFCKMLISKYIDIMPTDPTDSEAYFVDCDSYYTGYMISKNSEGRITVSAPSSENAFISITR